MVAPATLFLALATDPAFPDVRLEDAQAFHVLPVVARFNYHGTWTHRDQMRPVIVTNNPPHMVALWEADIAWRLRCWDKLDDVLYCSFPTRKKLESLTELRRLLGDEAYFGGQMPSPTPAYKWPGR